jgi:hypothetical protein
MTVDDQIRAALRAADDYSPSPDLFAKVQRSIEEDQARRARQKRVLVGAAMWLGVLVGWVLITLDRVGGELTVPWWSLEVAADFIMVSFVAAMGPLIRRFGEGLAGAVFTAHPPTGERFLRLIDIAYYLTLSAYILMLIQVTPVIGSPAELLLLVTQKVAGLVLLAGLLHGLTILVLPLVGLVFSSSWRRAQRAALGPDAGPPDPGAERADRVVRIITWVGVGIVGAFLAFEVISLIAVVIGGGVGG